jgi:molybdopterin-guanine dinucleotide biosynthesis protein A
MTSVIILAQGRQTRFKSLDYPKCLIEVSGEPLLMRTFRLLRGIDEDMVPNLIAQYFSQGIYDRLLSTFAHRALKDPGYCVLDGLAQTTDLWSKDGRTVVLLGDVCYSREAIREIFATRAHVKFFCSPDLSPSTGEIYALTINAFLNEPIIKMLQDAPCRKIAHKIAQPGHLRNLLWDIQNERTTPSQGYCTFIDDFTTDFDTDEDLKQIPELVLAVEEARKLHADVCERIPYPNPKTTVH